MSVAHPRRTQIPEPEEAPGAQRFLPAEHTLGAMRAAVVACQGCPLYRDATQAVFGEGVDHARVMMIGEQPGDSEDLAGKPFVGPAGHVLDAALAVAGIPRDEVYVTNVVKHFKFTRRGKRRIHDKPTQYEIAACRPWLVSELALVAPDIVVVLGATAAQSLLGRQFRVTRQRGELLESELAEVVVATVHPSSILRAQDADREREFAALVDDLTVVASALGRS